MKVKIEILIMFFLSIILVIVSCDANSPITKIIKENQRPKIISFYSNLSTISTVGQARITCIAVDDDKDILTYTWESENGIIQNTDTDSVVLWTPPLIAGMYKIKVIVNDKKESIDSTLIVNVISNPCGGLSVVIYEGKEYHTIEIGPQCWLQENLNVGVEMRQGQMATDNGIIEKNCLDCEKYGGLYQWKEAIQYNSSAENDPLKNSGNIQGICPPGWHIPSVQEFEILKKIVNGNGNSLKAKGENYGTNISGFSALFAGYRYTYGTYHLERDYANFWSSNTPTDYPSDALFLNLNIYDATIRILQTAKGYGFCVRCIKD